LSRILLRYGLMDELPNFSSNPASSPKSCQGGKAFNFDVSDTNEAENKRRKVGGTPPSNLVS
jgi:hypothetical protein